MQLIIQLSQEVNKTIIYFFRYIYTKTHMLYLDFHYYFSREKDNIIERMVKPCPSKYFRVLDQ